MKRLLIIFLLITSPAQAGILDDWDTKDKILLSTYTISWTADWGQTRYIASHPEDYYELNNTLGEHPSTKEVDEYFLGLYIVNIFISNFLKPKLRKGYLLYWTIEHTRWVIRNKSIGIGFNFSF